MAEAGELVQALQQGYLRRADIIEIGQLLAGGAAAGRRSQPPSPRAPAGPAASGPTIFKSVGIAAQDWAACELVVRRAREAGAIPAEARRRRHSPGFPDDERR